MKNNCRRTPPFALTPLALAMALNGSVFPALAAARLPDAPRLAPETKEARSDLAKRKLMFEPNVGQADGAIQFIARAPNFGIALGANELLFDLAKGAAMPPVRMRFLDANFFSTVTGIERVGSHTNYALGSNPAKWRQGVPNYSRVRIESLYAGIDAVFYGTAAGELEYDLIFHAGAAPRTVRMQFEHAEWLELDDDGTLKVHTEAGVMRIGAPRAYQSEGAAMMPVDSRFILEGPDVVAFATDAYDPTAPLVIDPVLEYSTYLGGSGSDWIQSIAVDPSGSVYAAGGTSSLSFIGGSGTQFSSDAFLSKFDAVGNLLYTSFFGGSSYDAASSVVLGSSGNVYMAGTTCSNDLPTVNAYQPAYGGNCDAFLARFAPDTGALQMATYLGGSGDDGGGISAPWPDPAMTRARPALALGVQGEVVMAGATSSANFPHVGRQLPASAGSDYDAFVARFSAAGDLLMSSRLGGSGADAANAVVADSWGNIVLGGLSQSAQGFNGFVQRIAANSHDGSLTLGSAGKNEVVAVALGGSGSFLVGGNTDNASFPVTTGPSWAGGTDMFVAMVNVGGNGMPPGLVSSRLIGGSGNDVMYSMIAAGDHGMIGAGRTSSANIPAAGSLQAPSSNQDAYVFKFDFWDGFTFGSRLGGSLSDSAYAVRGASKLYVAGATNSIDFPLQFPSQGTMAGNSSEGFLSRIDISQTVPTMPRGLSVTAGNGQATVNILSPVSDGNSPITGYAVSSNPPGGIDGNLNSTSLNHVITGLTNGQPYTFTVVASNAFGASSPSLPSIAITPAGPPSAPAAPQASAGNGIATVTFTAPASNGRPITGYVVASNPPGGIDGNQGSTGLSHTMTGLINGQSYTFTVTATNSAGTSPPSAPSSPVMPVGVPGAPSSLNASAGNGQASLSFAAPLSDGGSTITQYTVICTPACGITPPTGSASPIIVPNLTNGVSYTFAMRAQNRIGYGALSSSSNAVTPVGAPAAPTAPHAAPGNGQATVTFIPPASNGGSPVTQYKVVCAAGCAGTAATGAGSSIVVPNLNNGVSYTFFVIAHNQVGDSVGSTLSNPVIPFLQTVPGVPTNVAAIAGKRSANVSFNQVAGNPYAAGQDPTLYTVTCSAPGQPVRSASAYGSPIKVNGLKPAVVYSCSVTAGNSAGTSPVSAPAQVVPLPGIDFGSFLFLLQD